MKTLNLRRKLLAIATGIGILMAGSGYAYWRYSQRQWCVQFTSSGNQEVTYSRGCSSPERYKKWSVTAFTLPPVAPTTQLDQ